MASRFIPKVSTPTSWQMQMCTITDVEACGILPTPAYSLVGSNFYKTVTALLTHADAKANCEADGGHLLMLKTEMAFNEAKPVIGEPFLNGLLFIGSNSFSLDALAALEQRDMWIGLSLSQTSYACYDVSMTERDADCDGIFEWIDGTPLSNPREDW